MYKPTLKEYSILFTNIFYDVIFKYKYMTVAAVICSISVFISTYYFTQVAEASAALIDKSSVIPFNQRLYFFFRVSILSVCLRCIPQIFFTCLLQFVEKSKFIENVRDYKSLTYNKFHKRTLGEMRFTVFLKSLSYPICVQIVVFDFTTLIGGSIFTFFKAYNDLNLYVAIIFSLFPICYFSYMLVFLKYKIIYHTLNLIEQEKTSSKIYDKLSNYDIIKTYNLENSEIDSLKHSLKAQTEAQLTMDLFTAKGKYVIRFIIISPYVFLALFSLKYPGSMSGSLLFQATLLYSSLSVQIKKLGIQLIRLANLLNQIRFDSINNDIYVQPNQRIHAFQDRIEFINVDLYHEDTVIIREINCCILKDEKIEVVGKNGTGKSTFMKSILGFTKYTGDILIDGVNIRDLSNRSIFSLISYIPQDDYTSDDTVINNLKLGNKRASREFIENKAKLFDCHDTFLNLEHGYDTQAGIRGNKLSGGQKQKISLVRAAVKDSPIFILDEATSAIDKSYEITALRVLFEKIADKTILMIIHEKEYLRRFDRIFFLNNRALEDTGEYNELYGRNENFRKFVEI